MSIRIWLSAAGTKAVETEEKTRGSSGESYEVYHLDDFEVDTDKSSREKYINIYADPLDPTASMPRITRKYVKRVSYTDKYFEGFRTNGIYCHKGATARVETIEDTVGGFGDDLFERRYQTISISAGSIRTLREIYAKIRSGEMKVEQNWSACQHQLEDEKANSAETATTH